MANCNTLFFIEKLLLTLSEASVSADIHSGSFIARGFLRRRHYSKVERNLFNAAASAFGPFRVHTLEGQPVGFNNTVTLCCGDATITLNVAQNFGPGFSGISNTTFGNLDGFNITKSGSEWLGFPHGSATFNLARPTHEFGLWLTGLQTVFGTTLQMSFMMVHLSCSIYLSMLTVAPNFMVSQTPPHSTS